MLPDDLVLRIGLSKFPWESDRVRNWRLRAEERYIAPYDYDPTATKYPPPWDSPEQAPPEALAALAHVFRSVVRVE